MEAFSIPAKYGRSVEVTAVTDQLEGNELFFSLDDELNQRLITSIDVWSDQEVEKTPSGNDVVSLIALTNSTLTLQDGSDQKIKDVPLRTFRLLDNGGIRFLLDDFIFNMQSSSIRINADNVVNAGESFYFTFWYNKRNRYDGTRLSSERTYESRR